MEGKGFAGQVLFKGSICPLLLTPSASPSVPRAAALEHCSLPPPPASKAKSPPTFSKLFYCRCSTTNSWKGWGGPSSDNTCHGRLFMESRRRKRAERPQAGRGQRVQSCPCPTPGGPFAHCTQPVSVSRGLCCSGLHCFGLQFQVIQEVFLGDRVKGVAIYTQHGQENNSENDWPPRHSQQLPRSVSTTPLVDSSSPRHSLPQKQTGKRRSRTWVTPCR